MPGTLTISGGSTGDPAGSRTIGPFTISGVVNVGETYAGVLASGDNTIPVPAGAVAAVIVSPPSEAGVVKVRTNTNNADAGLVINSVAPQSPLVYPFPATPPTSIILNSSVAQAAPTTVLFI